MVWEIKLFVVISEILLYDLKEYEETGGKIDEETYCTYLYLYDGHLKELFMREGASLGGQVLPAGTDIMDLQEFSLSYASDDLIRISLRTASGEDHTFYIHVHCNTTTE